MKQLDRLFLILVERVVDLKVSRHAQAVDLIGRALLKPELGATETVGKIGFLIGRTDLLEYGFQHRYVEVHNRAKLYEQSHRHGGGLSALHVTVIHNILRQLVRASLAAIGQHLVKLEILTENAVVKANIKGLGGIGLGIEPEQNLGLIELEKRIGREIESRRARHLTRHTLDTNKLIALENGGIVAKDLLRDDLGVAVRSRGCGVILAARLKVNLLIAPTHCPVYLPTELAVKVGLEIEVTAMTATAGVICLGTVLGERGDLRKVGMTLGAENADGRIDRLLGIVLRLQLLGRLRLILGLEGIKDLKNLVSLLNGLDDVLRVLARTVHLGLIAAVKLHAKGRDALEELLLKVCGIAFVTAPRIGNVYVRTADVFVVIATDHSLHVGRDLTATVELVPRDEQLCLFAFFLKCLYHKQRGGKVTEVSDMNRSRGTDACGTDVGVLFRVALDDLLRNFF